MCTSHAHRNAHRHDTCCVCGRTRSPRPPPTRTRLHSQHTNTITMSLVSTPPHRTGRGIGPVMSCERHVFSRTSGTGSCALLFFMDMVTPCELLSSPLLFFMDNGGGYAKYLHLYRKVAMISPCEPTCVLSCLPNRLLKSPLGHRVFLVLVVVLSRIDVPQRVSLGNSIRSGLNLSS